MKIGFSCFLGGFFFHLFVSFIRVRFADDTHIFPSFSVYCSDVLFGFFNNCFTSNHSLFFDGGFSCFLWVFSSFFLFSSFRVNFLDWSIIFFITFNIITQHEKFLTHSSYINNFLKSFNSIFKDWFDRLHDTESSLHIIDLWLHSFNSFHLSSYFN